MGNPIDYSKTIFSQGLMCYNTNNCNYCIVINGEKGSKVLGYDETHGDLKNE